MNGIPGELQRGGNRDSTPLAIFYHRYIGTGNVYFGINGFAAKRGTGKTVCPPEMGHAGNGKGNQLQV